MFSSAYMYLKIKVSSRVVFLCPYGHAKYRKETENKPKVAPPQKKMITQIFLLFLDGFVSNLASVQPHRSQISL